MIYKDFYITLSPKKLKSHIIKQLKMLLSISETEAFQRIKVMGTRNCEKKTGIKFNLFKSFFAKIWECIFLQFVTAWFVGLTATVWPKTKRHSPHVHSAGDISSLFSPLCRGHIVFISSWFIQNHSHENMYLKMLQGSIKLYCMEFLKFYFPMVTLKHLWAFV